MLVAQVPLDNGPLIVATPTMFAVMQRIVAELPEGGVLGDLARRAIGQIEDGQSAEENMTLVIVNRVRQEFPTRRILTWNILRHREIRRRRGT